MAGIINVWDEEKQTYVPMPAIVGKDGRGIRSFGYDGAQDKWAVVYTDGTTDIIQGPTLEGGAAGVSPVVEFSAIAGGTRLSITDAEGIKTADILDGRDGNDGKDGTSVTVANVSESSVAGGISVVTFSDGKKLNVKNGTNGQNGSNGTSVTVTNVSESSTDGGTNTVTFSDGKRLQVKNGRRGTNGTTPVKGRDYFTDADKQEIAEQAAALVPGGDGKFVVNAFLDNDGNVTFDKTFSEAYAAYNAGKTCEMVLGYVDYPDKYVCALREYYEYETEAGEVIKRFTFSQEQFGRYLYVGLESDGTYQSGGAQYVQITYEDDGTTQMMHQKLIYYGLAASETGQKPEIYLLRNTKLAANQGTPTVNGEICWTYE